MNTKPNQGPRPSKSPPAPGVSLDFEREHSHHLSMQVDMMGFFPLFPWVLNSYHGALVVLPYVDEEDYDDS